MKGTKRVKLIAVALALILSIGILAGWAFTDVKGNISIDAKCGEENVEVASATATIEFTNADETKPALEPIALEFKAGSLIVPDAVKEDLALADEAGYTAKLTYTLNATGYDQVTGTADMKALVEESNDENVPTEFKAISASFVKTQYKLTFSNPKGVEQVLVNGEEVKDFSEGISVTYFDEIEIVVKEHYTCEESKIKNLTADKNVMIGIDFDFEYEIVKSNANGTGWELDTDATVSMKKDFDWDNYAVAVKLNNGNEQTITKDSPANFKTSGMLTITVTDKNDPTQTWSKTEEIENVDGNAPYLDPSEAFTVTNVGGRYQAKLPVTAIKEENIKSVTLIAPAKNSNRAYSEDLRPTDGIYIYTSIKQYSFFDVPNIYLKIVDKAGNVSEIRQSTVIVEFAPDIYGEEFENDSSLFVKSVKVTIKNRDGKTGTPTVKFNMQPIKLDHNVIDGTYSFIATKNGTYTINGNDYPVYRADGVGIIDNAAPVFDTVTVPTGAVNAMTVTVNDYCDANGDYAGAGVKNVYFAQVTTSESVSATPLKENAENAEEVTGYKAVCTITIKNSDGAVIGTVTGEATAQSASGENNAKEAATETAKADFKTWLNDNRDKLGNIMTGEQVGETNQYVLKPQGNGKYQLAIWAEDKVLTAGDDEPGNLSDVILTDRDSMVNVDTRAPEFGAVSYAKENEYSIVHDQTISVPVTDNNGVKTVEISYTYNGEEKTALMSVNNGNYSYSFADGDGEYKVLSITATDITEPEANEATLEVNTAFTIDSVDPQLTKDSLKIALVDDKNKTQTKTNDANFYGGNVKISFAVTEDHYKSGTLIYTKDGIDVPEVDVVLTENNEFELTLEHDAVYKLISLELVDKAGNTYIYRFDDTKADGDHEEPMPLSTITLDKTYPTISVKYDNNDVRNDKFFNNDRVVTITVKELNFNADNTVWNQTGDASGVYIVCTGSIDGQVVSTKNLETTGWDTEGDVHKMTIKYDPDADYKFDVYVVDKAGNYTAYDKVSSNDSVAPDDFTVDKTKPTITVTGITNGTAYNGEVAGSVEFSDINFNSATIKITRADKNGVYDVTAQHAGATPVGGKGGTVSIANFDRLLTNDGIYTLTATAIDMAGNEADPVTITFSVNRFGSTYKFDDYLASICDKHIKSVTDDLKITEINPDSITSGTVTITRNGKVIDSGDIAAVLQRSGSASGGWYEYLYTISKDLFKEDGMYKIVVSSKDAAGNEPNSENDEEFEIVFWVDDTPAEIAGIQGLEDAIINAENHTVKFTVRDNIGLKSVTVYCDGKEIAKFGEKDFTAGDLVDAQFTISEASSAQHIRIVAEDLSGNILDTDGTIEGSANTTVSFERDVTVSTNFFVRWFANKPLFFGSIAVIVAAGVGIYFIVAKKHKKEKATAE